MHTRQRSHNLRTSLRADQSGMALIYVTLLLPIIIGFALLAVDASRVYILSSSLQHGADFIAPAMAVEFDLASNAITHSVHATDMWSQTLQPLPTASRPSTATRTVTGEDLKATWSSS